MYKDNSAEYSSQKIRDEKLATHLIL